MLLVTCKHPFIAVIVQMTHNRVPNNCKLDLSRLFEGGVVLYCFGIYFLAHACAAFTPMAFCAFILLQTGSISFCSRYHKGLHLKAIIISMFISTIMITWDH